MCVWGDTSARTKLDKMIHIVPGGQHWARRERELGLQLSWYNPPTTSFVKRCYIKMKFDRTLRQLQSNTNEATGHRDQEEDVAPQQGGQDFDFGPWSYDNIDPTKNMWLIAVTDDNASPHEASTGEHVKIDVIRRVWWQDDLPPNRDHADP